MMDVSTASHRSYKERHPVRARVMPTALLPVPPRDLESIGLPALPGYVERELLAKQAEPQPAVDDRQNLGSGVL